MRYTSSVSVVAVVFALATGAVAVSPFTPIATALAAEKAPTLSAKVGKPMQEAQKLFAAKDFKGALAKVQEAEKIPDKKPYESYVVANYLGFVLINLQDYAGAVKAFETALASGLMPAAEVPEKMKAIAQMYYQIKNYPKTIEIGSKYLKDVGPNADIQLIVAQSQYLQNNFKAAADGMRATIKASNGAPKEEWLQLLMSAEYKQQNTPGVQEALEQLVSRYPKPDYWSDLLTIVEKKMKPGSNQALDIYRLMFATGTMKNPEEFTEMAELALQQGYPGEAKAVVEKGFAAGVLGTGTGAERHNRLRTMATTQTDTDKKQLAQFDKEADAAKTGDAYVKLGAAYTNYGMHAEAVAAIQKGIAKGGLKDMDDANLRLGLALLGAGKRTEALAAFKSIAPNTTTSEIARLWTIQSQNPKSA